MRTSQMSDAEFLAFVTTHPVSGGKGASAADEQRKQELAMQQQAFNKQMQILNQLGGAYNKYLSGKIGFDPQALSGMTSQFLNSNNQTFNQASQEVRSALGARGELGSNPVGGNYVRGLSSLLGAKAGSQSQGLLGLQVQNAMQAQNNMWNAGNVLSGNAATLTGTQGVAGSAASSALNDYIRAKNSGFLSSFTNALGAGLGGGIASFGLGGLTKLGGFGTPSSVPYGATGGSNPVYGGGPYG